MNKKDLLRVADYTPAEITEVFEAARDIKAKFKKGIPCAPLAGKTLGMLFQKSSTRTRFSSVRRTCNSNAARLSATRRTPSPVFWTA